MVELRAVLMGYPYFGFVCFGEIPKGHIDFQYKVYYVNECLINGHIFYLFDN